MCEGDGTFPSELELKLRTAPLVSDYDPLTSLSERYPNSRVILSPYSLRYPQAQTPYPAAVPYYAAREYGLPGLGYVVTDPYSSYAPSANTEQVTLDHLLIVLFVVFKSNNIRNSLNIPKVDLFLIVINLRAMTLVFSRDKEKLMYKTSVAHFYKPMYVMILWCLFLSL